MKTRLISLVAIVLVVLGITWTNEGFAEVKEFKVPALADFSGPYADLMKFILPVRDAVVNWWNDKEGQKLGIKLSPKAYDTRYDPTVVASLWPGILEETKPFVVFGLGGTDVAALQQRLPKDKVPIVYAAPAYGYGWLPDQWVFQPRATYAHEYMAALVWYINQHPEKRPVRVAFMSSQASPAYVDIVNGCMNYVKKVLEPKGLAKVAVTEWIDVQPVDVSSQMKHIIDEKSDVILGIANTTMASAAIRAEQLHGVVIPTIASPHHTIWPVSMAMKSFKAWEGHYVVAGTASPLAKGSKAHEFYQELQKKYEVKGDMNALNMMGMNQGLLLTRAVEHAIKKVGLANLNGQAVYDALAGGTFTEDELMGTLPTLVYNKEAPFPTTNMKVTIDTVKNGEMVPATPGWVPIPADVTKW